MIKILLFIFTFAFISGCNSSGGDSSGGSLFNQESTTNNSSYTIYLSAPKTYTTGESISLSIAHSQILVVTGTPQVEININGSLEQMTYQSGSGTNTIVFSYIIQNGDNDLNGVSLSSNIDMNGGDIQFTENDSVQSLTTNIGSVVSTSHLVDTIAPEITSVIAPTNSTYIENQSLNFILNISEPVIVSGNSEIEIDINGSIVSAVYSSGSGTDQLTYTYTVQSIDEDFDGININSSSLNILTGDILDGASLSLDNNLSKNSALPDVSGVLVDAVKPTVSIVGAPNITASNASNYSVNGTCSDDGTAVSVTVGSISVNPICSSSTWSTSAIDVTGEADNVSFNISATQTDNAGNLSNVSSTVVTKNTALPTISLYTPSTIDQSNQTSYSLSGTCSENGFVVSVSIGSVSSQPNCNNGTWSISNLDVSSLLDNPAINISIDHANNDSNANQLISNVEKNTSGATVTISSANNISISNQNNYIVSGSCSENGEQVIINIDSITFTPTCSSSSWTTGSQDVSSITDSGNILITVDHSSATQATKNISKTTSTPFAMGLTAPQTLSSSINLSWSLNTPGGFSIDDYIVNYRVKNSGVWLEFNDGVSSSNSSVVTALNPNTVYEFRVRVLYDSSNLSEWSNTIEAETKPNDPLFTSEFMAMNVGGSTDTKVVALYDNTRVFHNGAELSNSPLSKGQVVRLSDAPNNITTSQFDTINSDKPIYTAGRRGAYGASAGNKGNIVWQPTSWAGKVFSFNATRFNPQQLFVYATENSTIEVKQGSTVIASTSITAGSGTTLSWSTYGSYQVFSTGTILAFHSSGNPASNNYADPKPLLPSHSEMIGFASNSMRLTTEKDSTNYNFIHSNSVSGSGNLSKQDVIQINSQGTGSYYQGESLLMMADQKISGASYADSNGYCASAFMPTNLMKKNYAINTNADYVAFASKEPGTIDVKDSSDTVIQTLTLTRSGANPNAPYKARIGTSTEGTRFFSTVPVAAWYQPNNDDGGSAEDETILYGSN